MIALASCATIGTKFDPKKVDQLTAASSTLADATKLLGKPTSESYMTDGSKAVVWMYSTGTALGTGTSKSVSILFDRDGKMVRVLNRTQTNLH